MWLYSFLVLLSLSAHAGQSENSECKFFGGGRITYHGCDFLRVNPAAMRKAVRQACDDVCAPARRESVLQMALELKGQVDRACGEGQTCSTESLDYAQGCLNAISKALSLAKELEEEAKRKKCEPEEPTIS